METETKQRQDINQGNATAWQTANDTTRKQNKRETEISVRGVSALVHRETWSTFNLSLLSALEERGEYDAKCQDKMLCITETKESLQTQEMLLFWGKLGTEMSEKVTYRN